MMPKLDGIQVLQALRAKQAAVPVLLLTAKSQVEDRVAGLENGADDYLPKPFDSREFVARNIHTQRYFHWKCYIRPFLL